MINNVAIIIENLSKHYVLQQTNVNSEADEKTIALENINIEIKRGEAVGIIGSNGSGKSTLLKILAGVTNPTYGKVEINGRVASILEVGAGFHPELTGRDNVYLNAQLLGFSKNEVEPKFNDIIEFSGIGKFIDEPVKNYSSGMFLRLAFSIMANLDFDVYLLDEVMSVGDAAFQFKVNQFLQKQRKNKNVTFVFVSHDLKTIASLCDYCFLFEKGKILEKGGVSMIDKYLSDSLKGNFETDLSYNEVDYFENELFQNEYVSVEKVSLNTNDLGEIYEDMPIEFECVMKLKNKVFLDVAFGIQNLLSQDICFTSTIVNHYGKDGEILEAGKVLFKATLPAFTLKHSKYILNFTVVVNNKQIVVNSHKAFIFNLLQSKNINNEDLINSRISVALIDGNWKVSKL